MNSLAFDLLDWAKKMAALSMLALLAFLHAPEAVEPWAVWVGLVGLGAAIGFLVASKKAEAHP